MQLSELMKWVARLLPKQTMTDTGDNSVQAGKILGNLNHTQTNNTYHYNIIIAAESSTAPATKSQKYEAPAMYATKQDELLALMRSCTLADTTAMRFMRREFQSTYVKRLSDRQASRVISYVETVLRQQSIKENVEGRPIWLDR